MPTVLIGWELGAGNGHLHRLVPIIQSYLQREWNVVAAVRAKTAAQRLFAPLIGACESEKGRLEVVQAPIFLHQAPPISVGSLAQIMANIGFADLSVLRPVVSAWKRILDSVRPDAVLSDMAPSLNIAVGDPTAVVVIGNGWTIPPDTATPMPFADGRGPISMVIDAADRVLGVATALGGKTDRFSDLLRGRENLVCTLEPFDPYADARSEDYCWPFEILRPVLSEQARDQGLIYFPRDHPALATVLPAIEIGSLGFQGYFTGEMRSAINLTASPSPLDLREQLPRSTVAIHHGGLATAIECLINRVPQFVCPVDFEKHIIARGLERTGYGMAFPANVDPAILAAAIAKMAEARLPMLQLSRMQTCSSGETLQLLHQAAK